MVILKNIFLWFVVLVSAYFFGFYVSKFHLIFSLISLAVFVIFFFLFVLFEKKLYSKIILSLASIILFSYPFLPFLKPTSGAALALVFLFFLWAILDFKSHFNNSLKISIPKLFKVFSPKFFTGLCLFLCLTAYFYLIHQNFPLPYNLFEKIASPVVSSLSTFNCKDIYKLLCERYQDLDKKTKDMILFGILIVLFVTLKGIFSFFSWIFSFLTFILFILLKSFGFFTLQYEPRDKEIIKM